MALRVVSQNVLADAYVNPMYYPHTPPAVLDPAWRRPALATHLANLAADVYCLQEVEPAALAAFRAALPGHEAHYAQKTAKPDGVATLTRLAALHRAVVRYDDGTGHVALLVVVEYDGRPLGVATTHVKWAPPGARLHVGVYQAEALLDALDRDAPGCDGWIVCGDFNAPPGSALVARVLARGWCDAYADRGGPTANANGVPKRIDFLFHSPSLVATPDALPAITATTPLPSATQPSDHLALGAAFAWAPAPG